MLEALRKFRRSMGYDIPLEWTEINKTRYDLYIVRKFLGFIPIKSKQVGSIVRVEKNKWSAIARWEWSAGVDICRDEKFFQGKSEAMRWTEHAYLQKGDWKKFLRMPD